jgi:hypothetical protein
MTRPMEKVPNYRSALFIKFEVKLSLIRQIQQSW